MPKTEVNCERCGARCRVAGPGNPKAKMLRRSAKPAGFCVNCATHQWLLNTYPVNIQLAESGPSILLHPQVRELFADIMRAGNADAKPDEINWNLMCENWELPWPKGHRVKPSAVNPLSKDEIALIMDGKRRGHGREALHNDVFPTLGSGDLTIRSFEELNTLEPGLGDMLRESLSSEREGDARGDAEENPSRRSDDEPPPVQREMF